MGIGSSKVVAGLENPFPISPGLEKDLYRLSFVVSRLLNSPDIYDLNNLARPGSCGDYAVFLKDKLEKRLLPFIADLSGESLAVVYQNPLKSFDSVETRKLVCQNLSTTMVQLVSIVVACLTSLQFESTRSRLAFSSSSSHSSTSAPVGQKGGANEGSIIVRWLQQNRYVSTGALITDSTKPGYYSMQLLNPAVLDGAATKSLFKLQIKRDVDALDGTLTGFISATDDQLVKGYLKIIFLKPIPLADGNSILPIQLVDNVGLTWMCGVLNSYTFISLSPAKKTDYPMELLTSIFHKSLPDSPEVDTHIEERSALQYAETIFNAGKQNPQQILNALGLRGAGGTGTGVGYSGVGTGYGYGIAPQPPGGLAPQLPGGLGGLPMLPRRRQTILPPGYSGELVAGEYVIPPPAAKTIISTFKKHSGEIGAANNPAQVRATLLAAQVLKDRTIQTRICQDPYWKTPNLASIYPWSTLQFLSVANFRELGSGSGAPPQPQPQLPVAGAGTGTGLQPPPPAGKPKATKIVLHPEWKQFIEGLKSIYNKEGLPTLIGDGIELEALRFMDLAKVRGCSQLQLKQSPRVRFQEIQFGVQRLQKLYQEHAKSVWKILNSLIYIIADPDKKQEVVRLNPEIFSNPAKSTSAFVNEKARDARLLLIKYYLEVERIYTETILSMKLIGDA